MMINIDNCNAPSRFEMKTLPSKYIGVNGLPFRIDYMKCFNVDYKGKRGTVLCPFRA